MHSRFALAVAAGVVAIAAIAAISAAPHSKVRPCHRPTSRATASPTRRCCARRSLSIRKRRCAQRSRVSSSSKRSSAPTAPLATCASSSRWIRRTAWTPRRSPRPGSGCSRPGSKDGKPVPVIVTIILEFRLDKTPRREAEPPMVSPLAPGAADDDRRVSQRRLSDEDAGTSRADAPEICCPALHRRGIRAQNSPASSKSKPSCCRTARSAVRASPSRSTRRYGLDDAAQAAVEQWTFEPGKLNGQPVPVAITVVVEFKTN